MQRKSIRLKDFNYANEGYYFVTICINNKQNILSDVHPEIISNPVGASCARPELDLSPIGIIIDKEINRIASIYDGVAIDKYIIMPNHIHMILVLRNPTHRLTVSRIIQQFKGSVSKQIGFSIWQKLFYDRVIRNQQEYEKTWEYIEQNPGNWEKDFYYK